MVDATRPRVGVVGLPGKWSTETLADELEQRTGFRMVIDMGKVLLDLAGGHLLYQGVDLCTLDGLVIKKITAEYNPNTLDRLELLRVAEAAGVRVFSPAVNILRLIDRLSCTVTLRNHDVPMPDTCVTEDVEAALESVGRYGSAVFKPLYSTKARGMCVIEASDADADRKVREFQREHPMMYIQKRMELPGQDLGLVFLAGEYLGAYARVSQTGSWNTTINSGGRYEASEPDAGVVELARRAQAPFGMDFTTVDVAMTNEGPIVFEVSAFGGFRGAKEGIGINAAARYAEYVLKEIGA